MATKLTNEVVDSRLIIDERPITRLGEYEKASVKMLWECHTCNHPWNATANSVLNLKSGCPHCFGNNKHDNAYIDAKISGRGFHRVDDYINFDTPISWKCNCGHIWVASPNNVVSKQSNCPKCSLALSGANKSNREASRVTDILTLKNIKMVQPYARIIDKYDFECVVCNHQWNTALNNIINSGTGCLNCAGLVKQTNADVDIRLTTDDRPITRVGDYINATTKIEWRCHKCSGVWKASPDSVLNNNTGCAICGCLGRYQPKYFARNLHKKTIPAVVYLIEGEYEGTRFLKVGITEHSVGYRFGGDKKKYAIQVIHTKQMPLYEAYLLEQQILQQHITALYRPSDTFSGKTECLIYSEDIKHSILNQLFG